MPDANDDAHFNGFSGGGTVTLNAAVDVNALHLSSAFTGSIQQTTNAITVGTGHMLVGSGRLIGGAAALSLSGSYTQTGGIVSLQNAFTLSGSLSVTNPSDGASPSTAFTNTGAIICEGSGAQTITQGQYATHTLSGLTINNIGTGTSDSVIVNSSGGLNLSGTLTITLGNLDLDTFNATANIERGITVAAAAQATLVTDANLTVSGSISMGAASSATFSGSMTLTMNGEDQNLDLNASSVPNLTISSSSSTTITGNLRVSTALQVDASSTLALGAYGLSATGTTITNNGTIEENTGRIYHTPSSFIITDSDYAEAGSITLGDTVYFSLNDGDENLDAATAETVTISLSLSPGETESVTLTESAVGSGIFRGSIESADSTDTAQLEGNGILESADSVVLTITFTDTGDGISSTDTTNLADSDTTTTTSSSGGGGGGGGGGGSRRGEVLTSQGIIRRNQVGEVVGGETTPTAQLTSTEGSGERKSVVESAPQWSDLSANHPHAAVAIRLHEAGVVKGNDDGTVRLDRSLSRVEALTLLARTIGEEERATVVLPFNDINKRAWYAGPLRVAVGRGFVQGFPDGSFRPEAKLNVVQSLKLISIGLGLSEQEEEKRAVEWYDPYVSVGRQEGLISGTIDHGRSVTRGEFFSWLVKLLGK